MIVSHRVVKGHEVGRNIWQKCRHGCPSPRVCPGKRTASDRPEWTGMPADGTPVFLRVPSRLDATATLAV